ncbi:general substrate transporter [Aulographum hederae CBS 113979]|uniref:General substrate transporter n=1 Tax=Aulographum hederae CBS 113979 TaxID=1176131 RepID=A0A6G1GWQ2_9PEZI|nr:general substrate transporter [Aulographum hederae CBS 113979]
MFNIRGRALRVAITASAGSCYLLFGYDQGVLGGLVTDPTFLSAMGNPNSSFLGLIIALYNIRCLAGCGIAAVYGNKLGRTKPSFGDAASYGAPQMIVGRLISGLGNGMNTSTVPVYVSECSPAKYRGRSVATQLSIVIFGTVVAYWIDYGTITNLTGEVVWRFPVAFQNLFALFTIFTLPFLPETPRWLFSHGRKAESVSVLARLYDCEETDLKVRTIESEMAEALRIEEESPKFAIRDLLNDKSEVKNTRRLVLCFLIQLFQMFAGINVIAFYVTIVLETNHPNRLWLGTFPPLFLLDKVGRRPMLLLGSTALLICMVIFTAGIAVDTPATAKLALAMLFLYEISFGMSWNSIPWLYAPEITPMQIRHIGSATATFSEWLWTFVVALVTPPAIENIGWKFYILFCVMIALGIPFTYFFLPETNGKSLEEIDYIFSPHFKQDEGMDSGDDVNKAQTERKDNIDMEGKGAAGEKVKDIPI